MLEGKFPSGKPFQSHLPTRFVRSNRALTLGPFDCQDSESALGRRVVEPGAGASGLDAPLPPPNRNPGGFWSREDAACRSRRAQSRQMTSES